MVLTIRPTWPTSDGGPGNPRTGERLAVRRIVMPLMVERGYNSVTVEDITAATGISRRSFFRLFGGKHQIVSCDHEVYQLEISTHLLQHQGELTTHRAAKAAALIVDGLTAVAEDAEVRSTLLASSDSLRAEESKWFERHQRTLALFLSRRPDTTSVQSEMTAAAIIAAARVSIREHADAGATATSRFEDAISSFIRSRENPVRHIAIIETSLSVDELAQRLSER